MDSLNPDSKLPDDSKTDSTNDNLNADLRKSELNRRKTEKLRKEEIKIIGVTSDELVAIGKSTCGRWVKFQEKLGEGGYKTVYKAFDSEKGNNVAWCEFKPYHVDTREKQANMMHEIEIMVKMDHPNIVTCYDVFDEYIDMRNASNPNPFKSIILIQELMGEGTLKSVIKKNFINGKLILKFTLITYWFHQIVSALSYMHDKLNPPIIHRDLKADNCFLESKSSDKYLNVKVGDFGLAKELGNKEKNTMLGTVGFMAPEVYDEKYDAKVDIYAFGMLMLEVVTNRTPYDDCETVMQVAKETMSGKLPEIFNLVHDPATREVISCCIHPLPSYRPTAMELYYHPIFMKNMLPVEITPNFDKCIDHEAMVNYFVANILSEELSYHTKFNLRMDFRDKRVQKSLSLDEGESLEFDLDVYKKEDIPELIANLKSEFEENMREGLNPNKTVDAKQVNVQLEKIFTSMELQMQFLHKMIIGKRWFFILESILSKQVDPDLRDDVTGFSLLATYKTNWHKATKQLETEMDNYEKLGNSDEMKKISKIFKNPDSLKIESIAGPSNDSVKVDKKSTEGTVKHKCESIDTASTALQMPQYLYPMPSPMPFCPFSFQSFPYINQGTVHTNPYIWPPYSTNIPPIQSVYDPMSQFFRNSETPVAPPKKSEMEIKNNRTPSIPVSINSTEKLDQISREDLDAIADKILTLDDVMKFISSKSHRYSKHPFTVIPIAGQSNSFRIVRINDSKYIENPAPEESNYSSCKMKACQKHKSSKKPSVNLVGPSLPLPNPIIGYPPVIPILPNMPMQPPMYGGYPPYPNMPPVPPNLFQYWLQQQNYYQSIQQQQQQYLNPGFFNFFSQSFDSTKISEKLIPIATEVEEAGPTSSTLKEIIDESKNPIRVSETTNTKFMVRTIEETLSHISSSDGQTESPMTLPVDGNQLTSGHEKALSKKQSKPPNTQENSNKNSGNLKEKNCNLRITDLTFEKELSAPINSRGEEIDTKRQFRKMLATQTQFRTLGSQTVTSVTPITNVRRSNSIGTSTCKYEEVCSKSRDDLHRSSTCDVVSTQSAISTNVNSSPHVTIQKCFSATYNTRNVLPKAEKENVTLYKFGKML